jgi:hypothetical protein
MAEYDLGSMLGSAVAGAMKNDPETINQQILADQRRRRQEELELQRETARAESFSALNRPDFMRAAPQAGWRESAGDLIGAVMEPITGKPASETSRDTQNLLFAGDFTPFVGEGLGVVDTLASLFSGNLQEAGINATAAAIPLVPAAGVKAAVKGVDEGDPGVLKKAANWLLKNEEPVTEPFAFSGGGVEVVNPDDIPPEDYIPEEESVASVFTPPTYEPVKGEGYRTVRGDVEKLNTSVAKDPNMYVGPQGEGGIKGRYGRFGEHLASGKPVEQPLMSIGPTGEATFGNGRHRFAYLRDQGATEMPVSVPEELYDEFVAKFGIADELAAATTPADPAANPLRVTRQPQPAPTGPEEESLDVVSGGGVDVTAPVSAPAPASTKFSRTYDAQAFHDAIGRAKQGNYYGPAVEQKDLADYEGDMIMYLSEDGKSGFAVKPDGDLVSVFSTEKGRLREIMDKGKLIGASKLDAFDLEGQPLPQIYSKYGFREQGPRMKWDDQYRPHDWRDELGKPDIANMVYDQPLPEEAGAAQQVDALWGDKSRPDVVFEGVEPSQFTPSQWYRFGKHYNSPVPLGPENETAWYASLKPIPDINGNPLLREDGQPVLIPGGLMSTEPFTYWDDLFIKAQGINPNKLDVATRSAIHDRMVAGKAPPPGGFTDAQIFNQLLFGLSSPSNPLTKNMFAAVQAGAKGPEDLARIAKAGGTDFQLSSNVMGTKSAPVDKGMPGSPYTPEDRRAGSAAITEATGTAKAEKGGLGTGGSLDYTFASDLAQMMKEKPEYFRFKGAGEGGSTPAENWANFIDRLITQVPGLKAKTGSFGGVWQDPVNAATSAVDRHIMNVTGDKMFKTPKDAERWKKLMVKTWNADAKAWNKANKKGARRPTDLTTIEQVQATRGGADFLTEERFKLVNNPKETKIRTSDSPGGLEGENINPDVPTHLRPDVLDYAVEPDKAIQMSEDYKRVMNTVAGTGGRSGRGLFSDQWFIWDPARSRLEPHEIRNPGLESLAPMSERQRAEAFAAHKEAGYLAGGKPQPVGQMKFAEGDTGARVGPTNELATQRLRELLGDLNPSRLALFQYLAASMGGAAAAYQWLSDQKSQTERAVEGRT